MPEEKEKQAIPLKKEEPKAEEPKEEVKMPEPTPKEGGDSEIEALKKQVEMLKDMVGQNAIKSWEHAKRDLTVKTVKLKRLNEKIVVGWGKLDYSNFNHRAASSKDENILMDVYFADGTNEKINYMDFVRCHELVDVSLVSFDGAEEGVSKVELPDGSQIPIKTKFLNQ